MNIQIYNYYNIILIFLYIRISVSVTSIYEYREYVLIIAYMTIKL